MASGAVKRESHVGFVMEQAMGHLTHHRALAAEAACDPNVRATWMPVPYRDDDVWQRTPGVRRNMSLLLSLRARRAVMAHTRSAGPFDALFYHTQLTALLSQSLMARIPTVISLDATPLNADPAPPALANGFARRPDGEGPWDRLKFEWYRRAFSRAAALVTWSEWARRSVIHDYNIEPQRVSVIPPGVDLAMWRAASERGGPRPTHEKPRLLFVGVDFDRKGGEVLLKAFRQLTGHAELDVVSPEAQSLPNGIPGLRVHRNLSINSGELRDLYARADLFLLPTLNDCTPLAVLEAMASGLPVVASDVGAIREQVEDGVNGLLVTPGDVRSLVGAVKALLSDVTRRRAMGVAGRARAERLFCARRNYAQVLALIQTCIQAWPGTGRIPVEGDEELSPARAERRTQNGVTLPAGGRAWASEH